MFVGRQRETRDLDRLLDACAAGRGVACALTGDAGIGKTRLADELCERAAQRGFAVTWGRAWETGGAPAYWPWIEALRALGELAPEVAAPPPVRALLAGGGGGGGGAGEGEGVRSDPARERFELFEAASSYLRACARREPVLLVLDDLHVADLPTLELLAFVVRGLRATRGAVAVAATWRAAEGSVPPVGDVLARVAREAQVLALGPLTGDEVGELVRGELGVEDAPLATALFEVTEGNPLFLRETLHALARSGGAITVAAMRDVAASGGVAALVRARLAGAADEVGAMLEAAAVVGREVPAALLAEVAEQPIAAVERALAEATGRGLLVPRGRERWAFAHLLVREAFYREIAAERRRALHAATARALARHGGSDELATLAHHQLAALPDGDRSEALHTARRAADRARAQLAYEEAIALLERALAACDGDDDRAELVLALGWACTEAAQLERGRALFREAAAIARRTGDAQLLARAALGQGGQYVLAEVRGELVAVLREALAALGEPTGRDAVQLRARVLARLAAALTPSADPAEPLALARRALAMQDGDTDLRTRIDVAVGAGAALVDFGPASERIPVDEQLFHDARTTGDRVLELRAITRLICDHLERGDVASADAMIDARARLGDALAHPRFRWQTPLVRSMRASIDGRFGECEQHITEARELAAASSDPNAERCIAFHRFCMLLIAGRTAELAAAQVEALRVVDSLPDGRSLHVWITALALARGGDLAGARAAMRSLGSSHHVTATMLQVLLADCAVACGDDRDRLAAFHARLAPYRDATATLGPFGFVCAPPVASTLGRLAFALGNADEAWSHHAAALALAERMHARAHEAWVLHAWGSDRARAGSSDAGPLVDRAAAIARELAMPGLAERAPVSPPVVDTAAPSFALARDGTEWTITHGARTFRLKDVRGLGMLAKLVAEPDRELHVLDLVGEGGAVDIGDAGEIIDRQARVAYQRRIADLREELADAEDAGHPQRVERARAELEALTEQLAAALGLGGRERRAGAAAERARVTVQRRVREAIRKIAEHDAELGRHLDWTVRTGTFCAYEPSGRRS